MPQWIYFPPVAFIVIFCVGSILFRLLSRLAFRSGKPPAAGQGEAYACGEQNYDHLAQPDYSVFFPYAFFFTLAHVATLIMTTVPVETWATFALATVYIVGAIVGLYILFKK